MPGNKISYKRRHYFIKKKFQFQFILKFALIMLAGAIISTSLLFFFSTGTLTASFQNSKLVIQDTYPAIFYAVMYTNIITLVLISLVTIFVTLFVSHKIAGPMFRFEKDLKEIAEGNLTQKIIFRDNDQMVELAAAFNHMVGGLHKKIYAVQSEVENIIESVSESKINDHKIIINQLNALNRTITNNFKI